MGFTGEYEKVNTNQNMLYQDEGNSGQYQNPTLATINNQPMIQGQTPLMSHLSGGNMTSIADNGMFFDTTKYTHNPYSMEGATLEQQATIDSMNNTGSARANEMTNQNSVMGQLSPYISGASNAISGFSSLADIYTGFKRLDIAEESLDITKEKWAMTKQELARISGVRDKLNTGYMAKG